MRATLSFSWPSFDLGTRVPRAPEAGVADFTVEGLNGTRLEVAGLLDPMREPPRRLGISSLGGAGWFKGSSSI